MDKRYLVTGGCGFIGYHFVEMLQNLGMEVLVIDKCTYAANPFAIEKLTNESTLLRGDICNKEFVKNILGTFKPNIIVNLAAESHVDRSILSPDEFLKTNIWGTHVLLEASLSYFEESKPKDFLFAHVSTDEVYGDLKDEGAFSETAPLKPNSPYSASKAAADHILRAYYQTYSFPIIITRCSNNYGPRQFPEKLIPSMISRAMENLYLPIYGNGLNVRDWIHVEDHCKGLFAAIERGKVGEVYNLSGGEERKNIEVVHEILRILDKPESLITFIKDRKGHDFRYAMDCSKAERELGWKPIRTFEDGLKETIMWYQKEQEWVRSRSQTLLPLSLENS